MVGKRRCFQGPKGVQNDCPPFRCQVITRLCKLMVEGYHERQQEIANFVKQDFYVDDGLKSLTSVPEAVSVIQKTKDMLSQGGLRLHKFVCNSRDVPCHIT